jgi:hypothetical protein
LSTAIPRQAVDEARARPFYLPENPKYTITDSSLERQRDPQEARRPFALQPP